MAKQITRWQCEICKKVFETRELAEQCEAKGKEPIFFPVGTTVGVLRKDVGIHCYDSNETVDMQKKLLQMRLQKICRVVGVEEAGHRILYRLQDICCEQNCCLVTKEEIQPLPPMLIVITPLSEVDGGGWLAEVPDLPGCMSDGETPVEALRNVMDAKESWLKVACKRGQKIPAVDESKVEVEIPTLNVSIEGNIEPALRELEKIFANTRKVS